MFNIQILKKGRRITPFSLGSIANIEQWLDASQITGLTNNEPLSIWNDLSGNGRNITSFTGGPLYKTNIQNNMAAVGLESNQGMTGTYTRNSGDFTTVCVCKLTSTTNSTRRLLNGSNNWLVGPFQGAWKAYAGGALFTDSGLALDTNALVVVLRQIDGAATVEIFAGNMANTDTQTATIWPGTINFGRVGAFAEDFLGNLLEFAVYSRALSNTEIQSIFTGLNSKWAI